jgi:uncharacterized Rossmann fold enzyme
MGMVMAEGKAMAAIMVIPAHGDNGNIRQIIK